jgi:hypothetical protein
MSILLLVFVDRQDAVAVLVGLLENLFADRWWCRLRRMLAVLIAIGGGGRLTRAPGWNEPSNGGFALTIGCRAWSSRMV